MTRQAFHRLTITFVLAATSTGCSGPSPEQVESAKTRQPESAKVRQRIGAKIEQILGDVVSPHHYGPMALSPDGHYLALAPWERGLEVWELTAGKSRMLPNAHGDNVGGGFLAYSKDGRKLAGSHGRGIAIWSVPDGGEPTRITHEGGATKMVFTEGGRTLLLVDLIPALVTQDVPLRHAVVTRWDTATCRQLNRLEFAPGQRLESISPDGRYAVVNDFRDQQRRVCELATGTRKLDLPSRGAFTFSDDGSNVVHLGENELSMIEVPSGKVAKRFDIVPPTTLNQAGVLAISSRAKLLAVGRHPNFNLASIISLETGKVLGTVECGPNLQECHELRLSADGRTLVTQTSASDLRDQSVEPWLKIWRLPEKW